MEIYNDTYCVYVHINKINGKKYVGQTCQKPSKRWNAGYGYIKNTYFYKAIKKYGWSNFDHEIVASNLTKEEADNFEMLLIKKLNLLDPDRGYNLNEGGSRSRPSEETKQKIRESNSGENHYMYGKRLSDETKNKISEAKLGEKNNFYGKHHTEESKKKISKSNKGSKHHYSKKVYQYDLQENLLKEWDNMTRVSEAYNVGRTTVMRYCRNGDIFLNQFILKLEKI